MKISIAERRPDGSIVTILIEPFGKNTAQMHSVKCERNRTNGEREISRFFLDNEQEVHAFVQDYAFFRMEVLNATVAAHRIENVWQANNLNEVLA